MKLPGLLLLIPICSYAQNLASLKTEALNQANSLEQSIGTSCHTLWDYSETALKEVKSAAFLEDILEDEGFAIKKGVSGMPTAFVAEYGAGKPILGILAEYDALPGVGNAPEPELKPREDGITDGQGCGHNLFGSASVYAAVILKRLIAEGKIHGTIRLYGTPAEETVVGKVYMAKAGVFDDLDAALEWHPDLETKVSTQSSLAMNNFEVEFFGQAAHSSADPWNGRSALDAVEMMDYGVNMMREHTEPTSRIHYVITNGGEAPNVVPAYAKVWYYVRDINRGKVDYNYKRILEIAAGAAKATFTTYKVTLITAVHAYNLNTPLEKALEKNLLQVGPPNFTQEEQVWGKDMQKFLGKEEKGYFDEIVKMPESGETLDKVGAGSTDVAEVSYVTPTAGFLVTSAPSGVPWHSWATAASHGTSAGLKAAMVATKVLALTGIDIFTNPELVKEAKEFFFKKTGGKKYISPLPEGQDVPPMLKKK